MGWFIWSVLGWAVVSLPIGIAMGRAMARVNPSSEASDWQQIRNQLTEIMPGSGSAVAWMDDSREDEALSTTARVARKVA